MSNKFVIAFLSLVLGLILIFVFIDPLWSSINVLRDDIKVRKQELVKIETLLSKKQELKSKYQEASDEAEKIFLALPKEEDVPYLLSQFDAMALRNGLLLESVRFVQNEEEKQSDFSSITVEVELNGGYEAFRGYLNDLENVLRLMEVRLIKIMPVIGLSDAGLFEIDLNLIVYYQ